MIDREISKKINEMTSLDQKARKTGQEILDTDRSNVKELKKIVKSIGWPTVKKVGKKSSVNAWLIVQHATFDLPFQKKILSILKKEFSINKRNVDGKIIPYLTDKILITEHKPQRFGTQFKRDKKGNVKFIKIEKPKGVNVRRAEYGLSSIEEYMRFIQGK